MGNDRQFPVNNWAHNIKSPAFADAELAALRDSGLRGRFSFGYPQALLPGELMDLTALEDLKRREFRSAGLIDLGVSLRGQDRSAPAIWRREIAATRALGLPVTMHLASDRASAAKGFISVMHAEKFLGPDVQVVHATHASKRDLALLKDAGSPLSISPWTELEVGYGVPPLADMAASGVEMGLSVDNMILAGQADMFSIMRLAIDLAAGQSEQQGVIPNRRAIEVQSTAGAEDSTIDREKHNNSADRPSRALAGQDVQSNIAQVLFTVPDAIDVSPLPFAMVWRDAAGILHVRTDLVE